MHSENIFNQEYWNIRWENEETGWDLGKVSTPIADYFLQAKDLEMKILIPGCGNAHEAQFLLDKGFTNITLLDISPKACEILSKKFPPEKVNIVCEDFFNHQGKYNVIVEQTFFCALHPDFRKKYVEKMHELLAEKGKLLGLMFVKNFGNPFPPFGGSLEEYRNLFQKDFYIKILEPCKNSILPRKNTEAFFLFVRR